MKKVIKSLVMVAVASLLFVSCASVKTTKTAEVGSGSINVVSTFDRD